MASDNNGGVRLTLTPGEGIESSDIFMCGECGQYQFYIHPDQTVECAECGTIASGYLIDYPADLVTEEDSDED